MVLRKRKHMKLLFLAILLYLMKDKLKKNFTIKNISSTGKTWKTIYKVIYNEYLKKSEVFTQQFI